MGLFSSDGIVDEMRKRRKKKESEPKSFMLVSSVTSLPFASSSAVSIRLPGDIIRSNPLDEIAQSEIDRRVEEEVERRLKAMETEKREEAKRKAREKPKVMRRLKLEEG